MVSTTSTLISDTLIGKHFTLIREHNLYSIYLKDGKFLDSNVLIVSINIYDFNIFRSLLLARLFSKSSFVIDLYVSMNSSNKDISCSYLLSDSNKFSFLIMFLKCEIGLY